MSSPSIISFLEEIEKSFTAVKYGAGFISTINSAASVEGANIKFDQVTSSILLATDGLGTAIDIFALATGSSALDKIGGGVSIIALSDRLVVARAEYVSSGKIKSSTYMNLLGDLLGIAGAYGGYKNPISAAVLIVLSATVAWLGNSIDGSNGEDQYLIQDRVNQIDHILEENTAFNSIVNGDSGKLFSSLLDLNLSKYWSSQSYVIDESDGKITINLYDKTTSTIIPPDFPQNNFNSVDDAVNAIAAINAQNEAYIFSEDNLDHVVDLEKTQTYINFKGGNNVITTGSSDDTIVTGSGNDYIKSGGGNDDIHAGKGNDILNGGQGVDTYFFDKGDGNDVIETSDSVDRVEINADIISIQHGQGKSLYDLVIDYGDSDSVVIKNFYANNGMSSVANVFATNESMNYSSLYLAGKYINLYNSEKLDGLSSAENYYVGNLGGYNVGGGTLADNFDLSKDTIGDIIRAGSGNDVMYLGTGENHANGGGGNDYYSVKGGLTYIQDTEIDGQLNYDKIHIALGITRSDISAEHVGDNMIISYGAGTVIIENWYKSSANKIELLGFSSEYADDFLTWQDLEKMAQEKDDTSLKKKIDDAFSTKFDDAYFQKMAAIAAQGSFTSPTKHIDPLVLDLDGDGVQTTGTNLNVHFDMDGDGNREQTGWISNTDGFLVVDKNSNGQIDDGSEMFGATTGDAYAELSNYDTNHDGVVDSSDQNFPDLKVWIDSNYDGKSSIDELYSLSDLNIQSIGLSTNLVVGTLENGNIVESSGVFTFSNGLAAETNSISFISNTVSMDSDGNIIVDERLAGFNDIKGMGYARSLKESATINKALGDTLIQFQNSTLNSERTSLVDKILVEWAKTADFKDLYSRIKDFGAFENDGPAPSSENWDADAISSYYDIVSLDEVFSGKTLMTLRENSFLTPIQTSTITDFYINLKAYVYSSLIDATTLSPYKSILMDPSSKAQDLVDKIYLDVTISGIPALENVYSFIKIYKTDISKMGIDIGSLFSKALEIIDFKNQNNLELLKSEGIIGDINNPILTFSSQNEFLLGDASPALIFGSSLNDTISTNVVSTEIYAGEGNDIVIGGMGSDYIDGGAGNDIIDGGSGPDVEIGGDGDDTLGNSNLDKMGNANPIPSSVTFYGNTYTGGKGNDIIYGSNFGDIYNFNIGDGSDIINEVSNNSTSALYVDKIIFGLDVKVENVLLSHSGYDLIVHFKDSTDSITVKNQFSSANVSASIEQFVFQDGTIWKTDQITALGMAINGTSDDDTINGNDSAYFSDTINGGNGNDTINGLNGDDALYGGNGNDVITGGIGSDYIDGGAGNDVIDGGSGPDVEIGGDGDDTLGNSNLDKIGNANPIPSSISFYGNTYTGGKGNDIIYGSNFGDIYNFNIGDGSDIINEVSNNSSSALYVDKIIFGPDVKVENVFLSHSGPDLIISFKDSTDSITVKNQFSSTNVSSSIEQFVFQDGTIWHTDQITSSGMVINGTSGDDTINGNDSAYFSDTINGGDGNDTINGLNGDDTIYGGNGNDVLTGSTGSDYIDGGAGNDIIDGGSGPDVEIGGDGDDILGNSNLDKVGSVNPPTSSVTFYGNTYTGGKGDDIIYGSNYGDIYNFNIGDGSDTINEISTNASSNLYVDKIVFGADVKVENVSLSHNGYDLIVSFKDSQDSITIKNQFSSTSISSAIEQFAFQDGTIWKADQITSLGMAINGTSGDDTINGNDSAYFSDTINGGDGNDTINGLNGDDTIYGGNGNDVLMGGTGSDYIDGGAGNDTVDGGYGPDVELGGDGDDTLGKSNSDILGSINTPASSITFYGNTYTGGRGNDIIYGSNFGDIYNFKIGDGSDTIYESGNSKNTGIYKDSLVFGEGITSDDLSIEHAGKNLVLHIGTDGDSIFFDSWDNSAYKIEQLQFNDGSILTSAQVDALPTYVASANQTVDNMKQSMAAFDASSSTSESTSVPEETDPKIITTPQ